MFTGPMLCSEVAAQQTFVGKLINTVTDGTLKRNWLMYHQNMVIIHLLCRNILHILTALLTKILDRFDN